MTKAHATHNWSSSKFWLECDYWYGFKTAAYRDGKPWDTSSAASDRGTLLHDRLEKLLEGALERDGMEGWDLTGLEGDEKAVGQAANGILRVLSHYSDTQVGLELEVPLPHEPESVGHIDVAFWNDEVVGIIDAKFGQVKIEPDSTQNKGYAYAFLCHMFPAGKTLPKFAFLGIAQPAHSDDVLYVIVPTDEIMAFGAEAGAIVERQLAGRDLEMPKDVSTCSWCPAARTCGVRLTVMSGMLGEIGDAAKEGSGDALLQNAELVERVVRSRSEIERFVKECVEVVVGNPDMFPDWKRTRVANARKFDLEIREEAELIELLQKVGVDWPFTLATPAALKKSYPDLVEAIDELTVDMGEHVRLSPLGAVARRSKEQRPTSPSFIEDVRQAMAGAQVSEPEAEKPKAKRGRPSKSAATLTKALEEVESNTKKTETKKRGKK